MTEVKVDVVLLTMNGFLLVSIGVPAYGEHLSGSVFVKQPGDPVFRRFKSGKFNDIYLPNSSMPGITYRFVFACPDKAGDRIVPYSIFIDTVSALDKVVHLAKFENISTCNNLTITQNANRSFTLT